MQTANPALSPSIFTQYGYLKNSDTMTMNGVVTKTALLLFIVLVSAGWTWLHFIKSGGNAAAMTPWMFGGVIGGLILAVATAFKPAWSGVTAPLYAAVEGIFIGGLSAILEASFPGIVIQAALLTFSTLFIMLFAYRSGIIRATEKFKLGIVAATGGIAIVYLVTMVLGLFSVNVPFIYGNGLAGIGFSMIVVVIAALNLVLDFDFIENAARKGAPKYMEWYAGFALMVTLVWLYIEILRLLSKLRSRN